MAIYRAPRPEQNYSQIRNDVLRDERLSYRARGVLATILSHTDDWSTSAESMSRAGQEGRDAIRTALSELEAAGYLKREKRQDAQGRWSTQAVVYDTPQTHPVQDALLDLTGPPAPENPSSVAEGAASSQVRDITAGQTDDWKTDAGKPGANRTSTTKPPTYGGATADADAPAKAPAPADAIAKAVYDATEGMVKYLAVRSVAAKGLRVQGATPERVTDALLALYAAGRPLTLETLGQRLRGGKAQGSASAHTSHWASGGSFITD
jgi:hypothetical protein